VDVYINPDPAPSGVNQRWQDLGSQGLAWVVAADVFSTLEAGAVHTLTVGSADYRADLSQISWPLPSDALIYAQVDSFDASSTFGAVLESHEIDRVRYNNISGPVLPLPQRQIRRRQKGQIATKP
jgi:hypothetical protein